MLTHIAALPALAGVVLEVPKRTVSDVTCLACKELRVMKNADNACI
jgi:hypothetical protein